MEPARSGVEGHGWPAKRRRAWMPVRRGPTERGWNEGTRSEAKGRMMDGAVLLTFSKRKVSRCKSGRRRSIHYPCWISTQSSIFMSV